MAANIFQNGGVDNNWGTVGNWSLGAVPTAADGNIATFDATSPNCTVDTSARVCNAIDFTGFTNAITMTFGLTVSGNVILDPAMDILGASNLIVNDTGTLTSNGRTWPNALTIAGASQTYTLSGDWTNTGLVTLSGSSGRVINKTGASDTLIMNGGLSMNASVGNTTGSCNFKVAGGTWTVSNIGFNGTGTVEIAGNITFGFVTANTLVIGNGILKYTSGTLSGTLPTITTSANTTFNIGGTTWTNISISAGAIHTLTSDLNVSGTLTSSFGCAINKTVAEVINISGSIANASGATSGTADINLTGTGTWSGGGGGIKNNLTINTAGTITISGSVAYNTGTLTVTKIGRFIGTSTSTLITTVSTTFVGIDKLNFATVTVTAGITLTMDKFFKGSIKQPTRVQSTTTANYNVTFTGSDNKVTQFTNISNCTLTQKGRLIVASGANKGNNNGIIFGNTLPNGFALDGQVESFRGFGENQNNNGFVKVF